jgi:ribosome-binding protein aMBF1 (putative translation factor)
VKEKEIERAAMKFCMDCANFKVDREKKNEERDRGLQRQTRDTSNTRATPPYRGH